MKRLKIAAVLLCIVAAYGVFGSSWALVATDSYIQTWAELMKTTTMESAVQTMAVQFFGIYLLVDMLALIVLAVIPLQKAEKWAWIAILVLGGISLGADLVLWAPYMPLVYVFFALWIAAMVISAKPVMQKQ
jgi:hypothetical protein